MRVSLASFVLQGGDRMSTYEALQLMIAFATLILTIIMVCKK